MTAGSVESPAAGRDTRHGPLIITAFGLYARGEQNWLSVASVVRLMGDLGVEPQAVRSSVSRLKRRGVLESARHDGAAGYSLAAPVLETLAEGDVRIFERVRAVAEDGWIVVVFSVPESERQKRHELRAALTRLGFGTAAPGVWIAPGNLAAEARRTFERLGLAGYVDLFTGEHLAFGDLRSKVRRWWDLDELAELYAEFLRRYRPVLERTETAGVSPQEAFGVYVPMLTQWRRLPYRDPGLPLSLLPPGWNGVSAGELFGALNTALGARAREHALAVIHGAE
ncbi:PaaX family transcriptional regulator C-terminal domain-containing protein [Kitasatospora sp. DSM 101779]|uniref:PaaX family transcriptional regulator n=1 Tax=Kitasatospora sp. DSM 101779 TaxID=2853165 RepID=UPI0021DABABA|nr:PaaX family transcriptional regulator C-terminal domain-containing protein [Kitasatospora sp. DSM 101779]MCU7820785.1 PaaX family transcriptional regulator [Kitasatospora sp. DSM 101779]